MGKRNDTWGLAYKGGKYNVAHTQCEWLAQYAKSEGIDTLVDLCGGGGKIALSANRDVFRHVTYNEYDVSMFCLFKMIRNYTTLNWLCKELLAQTSTIDNHLLFIKAKEMVEDAQTRRLNNENEFDVYRLGLASAILLWGSYQNNRMTCKRKIKRQNEEFIRYEEFIPGHSGKDGLSEAERAMRKLITRLQPIRKDGVYTEAIKLTNQDAFTFLKQKKRRDDLLVYIDPPYINDGKKDYLLSWDIEEHEKLLKLCETSRLHIVICYGKNGYGEAEYTLCPEDAECYRRLLDSSQWHRYICNADEFGYVIGNRNTAGKANKEEIMLCNFVIPGVKVQ